ncbi:MAG: hypothetical protein QM477_09670 [Planctomycetota bacterium]
MEWFATLMTDMPLDERRFHGVLRDVAHSSLAGGIRPRGMAAWHSFGNAECDSDVRDLEVRVLRATEAPPSALHELEIAGFRTASALEFLVPPEEEACLEAWALVALYAEQLYGWVLTRHLDFETAAAIIGSENGLMHVPLNGGHGRKAVLVSAESLVRLTS